MNFGRKGENKKPDPGGNRTLKEIEVEMGVRPTIPHKQSLTNCDRLKLMRADKVSLMQQLNAEVLELDSHISWLERFPQVERIVEMLRNRQ